MRVRSTLPDWRGGVVQVPPGLWWVKVATPQLPVEALSRQRVLLHLECVVFNVVERWRDDPRPVLLDPLENWLSPEDNGKNICALAISRVVLEFHWSGLNVLNNLNNNSRSDRSTAANHRLH